MSFPVISREIRPWQRYTPPQYKKKGSIGLLSVVAGGGLLMPTTFAPLSIGGYNAARGLISRDIASFPLDLDVLELIYYWFVISTPIHEYFKIDIFYWFSFLFKFYFNFFYIVIFHICKVSKNKKWMIAIFRAGKE